MVNTHTYIRPDLIDVLFLGSFPDPFQSVEMIKKRKGNKNCIKMINILAI